MYIRLSDLTFALQFRNGKTAQYYEPFSVPEGPAVACLRATSVDLERAQCYAPQNGPPEFVEMVALRRRIADLLPVYDRCIFHSAAMVFRGRAYLFAAPCGTGKTTQLNLWQRLFPAEVEVINGDKPILQVQKRGCILVHPSPWRGKEELGGAATAPLAGIICLKQSKADCLTSLTPRQSLLPLLQQMFCADQTEENYRRLFPLLERLLQDVPVWLLENLGGENSARLCYQELLRWEEKTDANHS